MFFYCTSYFHREYTSLINVFISYFRFGAFETLKGFMADGNGQLSVGGKLLSGLGAGVCEAILAVTPMETIKVKFVHDQRSAQPKFKGFYHGVRTIIATEGNNHKSNRNSFSNN